MTARLLPVCGASLLAAIVMSPAIAQTPSAQDISPLSPIELLGKRLFEDTNLSEPKGQSCASCHEAGKAFTGNAGSKVAAVAAGAPAGMLGNRNVPTVMYAMFAPAFSFVEKKDEKTGRVEMVPSGGLFLDGRADGLAQQAEGPFLNPREMANRSKQAVVDKVKASDYAPLMRQAFGEAAFDNSDEAYGKIAAAIAAFENTSQFRPFASKFDAVLRGEAKFTKQEAKGFALFKDPKKGNCFACHTGKEDSSNPEDWLFTDYSYDNLGVPRNRAIPDNADPAFFDKGVCERPGIDKAAPKGVELEGVCGAFKVPTLRNVDVTGPYFHNGVIGDLRDAVDFYNSRDTNPRRWYGKDAKGSTVKFDDVPADMRGNVNTKEVPYDRKAGQQPRMTDAEVDAIVAFLKTLTDAQFLAK